jgi:hypothetical protein
MVYRAVRVCGEMAMVFRGIRSIFERVGARSDSDTDRCGADVVNGSSPGTASPRGNALVEVGLSPESQAKMGLSRSDEREVVKRHVLRVLSQGTEQERQHLIRGLRVRPRRPGETGGGPGMFPGYGPAADPGYHVFEPEELRMEVDPAVYQN